MGSAALQLLLLVMAAITSGCIRSYEYEHLVLTGEMQATELGSPEGIYHLGVDEFPIRYQLRRPAYVLSAVVDPGANRPNVSFYVVANSADAFSVTGQSIRCGGGFRPLPANDPIRSEFPLGEEQFTWGPAEIGPCRDIHPERVIHLRIASSSGHRYIERIPFRVVRNGTHWEIDAL